MGVVCAEWTRGMVCGRAWNAKEMRWDTKRVDNEIPLLSPLLCSFSDKGADGHPGMGGGSLPKRGLPPVWGVCAMGSWGGAVKTRFPVAPGTDERPG